ncbi:hypothetical protein NQ317_011442 [Molorchus minor]|uniref:RNase H type-1 domain-containing protein n=1 Tax=Molorchus minor TaxID=1323400 RepID=A0ABQ9J410_9CUCU|nr:hypothetical protein NQ317_011442 [Molorchus minor]
MDRYYRVFHGQGALPPVNWLPDFPGITSCPEAKCPPKSKHDMYQAPTYINAKLKYNMTIELCVKRLDQMNPTRKTIKIFSDSHAALKALYSYRCSSKTAWNCEKALNNPSLRNLVALVRIPSHFGQGGNEIADSLARKGALSNFIGPESTLGMS